MSWRTGVVFSALRFEGKGWRRSCLLTTSKRKSEAVTAILNDDIQVRMELPQISFHLLQPPRHRCLRLGTLFVAYYSRLFICLVRCVDVWIGETRARDFL